MKPNLLGNIIKKTINEHKVHQSLILNRKPKIELAF